MRKPQLAIAALCVCTLGVLLVVASGIRGDRPASGSSQAYYSDDDGQTYFVDSIDKIPPFYHGGKEADRAFVFSGGDGKFVGYLQRFKPFAVKLLNEASAKSKDSFEALLNNHDFTIGASEMKLPGPKNKWQPAVSVLKSFKGSNTDGSAPVTP